jgi:hypothetical protein
LCVWLFGFSVGRHGGMFGSGKEFPVEACLYVFFLLFVELGWRALIGWFLGRGVGDLDVAGIGLEGVCEKLISLVSGPRF